jgi:hypothetical protein
VVRKKEKKKDIPVRKKERYTGHKERNIYRSERQKERYTGQKDRKKDIPVRKKEGKKDLR